LELPEKDVVFVDDHSVGLHLPPDVDGMSLLLGQVEGQVLGLGLLIIQTKTSVHR
jgi:hypothetical protein